MSDVDTSVIRFLGHRQEELETRRPIVFVPPMQPIREDEPMETSTAETTNEAPRQTATAEPLQSPLQLGSDFPSQSGLSTIDTFQMRQLLSRHLNLAGANPNTEHKTSSVQIHKRTILARTSHRMKINLNASGVPSFLTRGRFRKASGGVS
jgi:hypothetical protein